MRTARTSLVGLALITLVVPCVAPSFGQRYAKESPPTPNDQTAVLDQFVGLWNVVEQHLDPSGQVTATVKGTEEITWVLDHHAIRREYSTKSDSAAYKATGFLTWNDASKAYNGIWFDNISVAGPTTVTATWDDKSRSMTFTAEGPDRAGGRQAYKTIEQFESDETRVATTFRIRGSEVTKILEVRYQRAAPCPDRLRIIADQ